MLALLQNQLVVPLLRLPGALPAVPLLASARGEKNRSQLPVRLARQLEPCFEQVVTRVPYERARKLHQPFAFRLYWLWKKHAACGMRALTLPEFAWLLDQPLAHTNPSLFHQRLLATTEPELARTNLPFQAEVLKLQGRIRAIHFTLPAHPVAELPR